MADKKISQLTAATTPLAGTEVLPIVQSNSTVKVSSDDLTVKNVRSNATTGILQVAGPGASTTRVMTVPNSNFTVARTDSAQTFSGIQTVAATFNGVQAEFGFTAGRGLQIATALNGGTNEGSSVLNARGGGAGQFIFQTEGTPRFTMENLGNLVVNTAGKGIDFSANTGAAGETSALLNWYEEGTYTVTLFDDNAGGNASATTVTGRYSRVGNIVHCRFSGLNSISTAGMTAGNTLYISLPFTPGASGGGTGSFACENFGFGAGRTNVIPAALASQARAIFRAYGSGTSTRSLLVSDVTSGSANIDYFSLTYQV
jgi:hypothetical protein